MSTRKDIQRARRFGREVGASFPEVVQELYFIGSRANGYARPYSDFDIVAVVPSSFMAAIGRPGAVHFRVRVPDRRKGLPKGFPRGFPLWLDGLPVDWLFFSDDLFGPGEIVETLEDIGGDLRFFVLWRRNSQPTTRASARGRTVEGRA